MNHMRTPDSFPIVFFQGLGFLVSPVFGSGKKDWPRAWNAGVNFASSLACEFEIYAKSKNIRLRLQ